MEFAPFFYLELKEHILDVPYTLAKRRIRVLLPKDYEAHPDKHYPVVYMHDGQNVFHSKEAFSKHSWKTIHAVKRNPDLPSMIIVGIDNGEDTRTLEYLPWTVKDAYDSRLSGQGGRGAEYSEFVVTIVKDFIDKHYRTLPDAAHTAMIGSSFGATISTYLGAAYKDQIGRLGIFSLTNWAVAQDFDRFIERVDLPNDQRIYIECGTEEGDEIDEMIIGPYTEQAYITDAIKYSKQVIQAGVAPENVSLNIFHGDEHSEKYWSKHLPDCLRFISQGWPL